MNAEIALVLSRIVELAPGIREFWLTREDGGELPAYSGGSHIVLSLPLPGGIRRNPYSLVGDPNDHQKWRIAVRRQEQSRGGSAWLHESAREGQSITVSMPANLFPMARLARHHILVAGGIGVTPIVSHARELARLGESFEVHYAHRAPEFGVLTNELRQLAGSDLYCYVASRNETIDFRELLNGRPLGTHAYLCGPQGMVEDFHKTARDMGWPDTHVHSERFLAPPPGEAFTVRLARSARELVVKSDQSMLEALEAAGTEPPFLCRGGACGQCETEVVACDSTIQHNDLFLSQAERDSGRKIMPCVSRLSGGCITINL
jgi:ferredoxin-NADP reductase